MRFFKRRFAFLSERGASNAPIGNTLALDALQGAVAARDIVDANLGAIDGADIKFREGAVQVLLSAMPIDAFHAALEDREHV